MSKISKDHKGNIYKEVIIKRGSKTLSAVGGV